MRLACVKHAASVHSEPGSNSPVELGADFSTNQTLGPEFRHCLVFKDRARRPAGPRSSNPAKISNRRDEVKRFFSRPVFFRAAKTPALSKNPANLSEDRLGVKRFFRPPLFFRPGRPWPARAARGPSPDSAARRGPRDSGAEKKREASGDGRPPKSGRTIPSPRTLRRLPKEPAASEENPIRKRPKRERLLHDRPRPVKPFFQAMEFFWAAAAAFLL